MATTIKTNKKECNFIFVIICIYGNWFNTSSNTFDRLNINTRRQTAAVCQNYRQLGYPWCRHPLDQPLHSCWGFVRCANTIMIIFMEKSVRIHTFRNPGCCLSTSWIYQNEIIATAYFVPYCFFHYRCNRTSLLCVKAKLKDMCF